MIPIAAFIAQIIKDIFVKSPYHLNFVEFNSRVTRDFNRPIDVYNKLLKSYDLKSILALAKTVIRNSMHSKPTSVRVPEKKYH